MLDLSDVEDDYVYLGVFRPQTAGEGVDIAKLRKGKSDLSDVEDDYVYLGVFRPQTAGEGVDIAKLRKGKSDFQ